MASRLRPDSRFIDSRLMAKARPSHGAVKAGSSGSKWRSPQPCVPPMSWIPSTAPPSFADNAAGCRPTNRGRPGTAN